jgi:two-component system chemotaxis sensor kinase CheA
VADDTPNDDFLAEFLDDYFAECDEHLTAVRRALLGAETRSGLSSSTLEELFRSFHSLKGLSGIVELREAELVAHQLESYLGALRRQAVAQGPEAMATLIEGTGVLEQVIASRRDRQPPPDIDPILARIEALVSGGGGGVAAETRAIDPAGPGSRPRWRVVFTPTPQLAARGVSVDSVRAMLRETGEIVDAAPRVSAEGSISFDFTVEGEFTAGDTAAWSELGMTATPEPLPAPAVSAAAGEAAAGGSPSLLAPSHFVRVDLARLDDLMRMIGDLVISRARLTESVVRLEAVVPANHLRSIQENAIVIERQLRGLREGVMRVRLVPVGEIFRRMPFVVRDLARDLGKQVELEMRGQDTEIDKFLIERMLDPVLHLVRNAISHGIESPQERRAAGKPETGRITLSAAAVGDLVVLEIVDDGRGVDADRVAARARAEGLSVPAGPLDAMQVLTILCAPGFSTRDAADRASGRGVGMAVVQTAVQELGGKLSLDSAPGQGSRFVLELPVTLAITDAILVRVGAQLFAVPQSAVREVVEIEPASIRRIEHGEVAPYRDAVLPLVRLSERFDIAAQPGRALHVLVIGHGQAVVGLAVDRIVGQREVVVRTLTDDLVKVDGVVGATDLGDGRVVLILDAAGLSRQTRQRRAPASGGRLRA